MEEELIDVRQYIQMLLTKWHWIVGAAILAGLAAFIGSSIIPPSYEATALVVVTQPTEIVEFDPRIRSIEGLEPLQVVPEIALSDELMLRLLPEVTALDSEIRSVEDVRKLLKATSGADPSLLRLTVTHSDPHKTSEIANIWADLFVILANQVYGNIGVERLSFYEKQAEVAAGNLDAAEQAFIDFQASSRLAVLGNQLSSLNQIQTDYLEKQRLIILLSQDVQALRDQLAQQPNDLNVTFADQLVSLLLQAKAFDVDETPLQLQWDVTDALVPSDRAGQIDFLDALAETFQIRALQVEEALAELEPQILALQAEKQKEEMKNSQVNRDFLLAEETFTALMRRVEEEQITSQVANSNIKLVSKSFVPNEPVSPKRLSNTVLAMVVGAMVAVGIVFLIAWYKEDFYEKPGSDRQEQKQLPTEPVSYMRRPTQDMEPRETS